MSFNIGDRVALINEPSRGKVVAILNKKQLLILLDDGIEIPISKDEVVKINDFTKVKVSSHSIENKEKKPTQKPKKIISASSLLDKHRNADGIVEVDLHAESLFSSHRGMSNGEILNYQINYFQRCLDEAIVQRLSKIIVIHGIGNGVLRLEIRNILKGMGYEFYDASLSRYGFGATAVMIR
jgi:dsDNA-specific endonuclease/ATPase MutS2